MQIVHFCRTELGGLRPVLARLRLLNYSLRVPFILACGWTSLPLES